MKQFLLFIFAFCVVGALGHAEEYASPEMRAIVRIYDDCNRAEGGMVGCFKKKAITFIDRMTSIDAISMGEGVRVVRNPNVNQSTDLPKLQTEAEVERSLPRGLDGREQALTNLLVERVARFFNTRSITINFPSVSSNEIARSVEEGTRSAPFQWHFSDANESFFLYSLRSWQDEEDDEHDDDGNGDENGCHGPHGDRWPLHVGG